MEGHSSQATGKACWDTTCTAEAAQAAPQTVLPLGTSLLAQRVGARAWHTPKGLFCLPCPHARGQRMGLTLMATRAASE